MVLSVLASPGCSGKDGCSGGARLEGLPGKVFIFILWLPALLSCNKTATAARGYDLLLI